MEQIDYYRKAEGLFQSMQLCVYYQLYYTEDFTKKKIKNFRRILDKVEFSSTYGQAWTVRASKYGLNLIDLKNRIPWRALQNMYGKRIKNAKAERKAINDVTITSMIYISYVLHKNYRFNYARIREFWIATIETMSMYADRIKNHLTDEHLVTFLDEYIDIKMCDGNKQMKGIR